jgi:hypothetical protein
MGVVLSPKCSYGRGALCGSTTLATCPRALLRWLIPTTTEDMILRRRLDSESIYPSQGLGARRGIHLIPHCIKTSRGLNPCLPNKAWSCMPWSYACQCRVSGWWRHLQACKCEERDLWCVLQIFCWYMIWYHRKHWFVDWFILRDNK